MTKITVALLQMASHGMDQEANRAKGESFCRQAAAMGADIALFPEMWNVGYTLCDISAEEHLEAWKAQAIGPEDGFVRHFQSLARELELAIGLTYLERWPGLPRNTVSLIDRYGEIQMTYAKVHTCDFDKEANLTPGEAFGVCTLDTAQGPVEVGLMICYDREFPESARILMLQGAELILVPNACELEVNRLTQFRARAFENMVGLAMTNYALPQANGHSIAFDGMAFDDQEASREMCMAQAGEGEEILLAVFDMEQLRAYRERETWGNAFRKPHSYDLLTSREVVPPFIRPNARR